MSTDPPAPIDRFVPAAADLRGLARLGVDAVGGVTDVVEAMHAAIARPSWPIGPAGPARTSGLTGFVYRAVRGTTRGVGLGLDAVLGAAERALPGEGVSVRREAMLAALNGVWGDHLAATGNPLAIRTALRVDGRAIDVAAGPSRGDGRRVLVMVHGLCMNDLQWRRGGQDHGDALARDGGWTPLYAHYNSGRHVADNGRELSALLESLAARWPVPIDEIAIVGHSMGGLVARSAFDAAARAGHRWPASVSSIACLGTPHHGAALERGGHSIDRLLGASPYVAPFARLARGRSAGITDLRHGSVVDADRTGDDRFAHAHDTRVSTPLPAGVRVYAVAATKSASIAGPRARLAGDGLVSVASALGDHRDPARSLGVPRSHRLVVGPANHWDLLDRGDVRDALTRWLR